MTHRSRSLLAAVIVLVAVPSAAAQVRRPNIVLILGDDLGYGETGFQGNKEIPTPNLDSIARGGIRFTDGYVSAPLCSPTRAGLMTGRYQTRYGHENNGQAPLLGLPLAEKTMADRLKALGYATAIVGKWHLGSELAFRPMKRGFDEFYGTLANTPYLRPRLFVDSLKSADVAEVTSEGFYTTDAYADRALDWIERNRDKPFFLYLPFNAVHGPLEATPRYLERFPHIPEGDRRTYAAMTSALDDAVGRVLRKLRDIGQEDNTLVIFLGDNGGPTPQTTSKNDPLRGIKSTMLEGGIREPFAIQWKTHLPAGKTYRFPIIQLDLLPTAIAAVGGRIDPAWKLDGVNLLPYLTGEKTGRPHETLYWRMGEQWAVRHGDWKLVVSTPDGKTPRLFDLAHDIGEAKDLASERPEKQRELRALWDKWNAEQVAPLWPGPDEDKPKQRRPRPDVN